VRPGDDDGAMSGPHGRALRRSPSGDQAASPREHREQARRRNLLRGCLPRDSGDHQARRAAPLPGQRPDHRPGIGGRGDGCPPGRGGVSGPSEASLVTATHLRMLGAVAGYTPTIPVLQGIDLEVAPERCTVVLGPNGSGKSTILRVLYGLLDLQEGEIRLGDRRIDGTPTHRLLEMGVAFLPQGRSVFPQLTVDENLRVGGWIFGRDVHRLEEALDRVYAQYPLLANMSQAPAGSLSGGQQRMLEIARMVLTDPQVLLIDEPSAGLAPNLVDEVYVEIERLKADGKTVLLVDQNVEAAIGLADHVYIVEYGKVKAEGQVDDFAGDVAGIVREWLRV